MAAELSTEASFEMLRKVLNADSRRFAGVGGDVAFCVKEDKPAWWQVTQIGRGVSVRPGRPAFAICTIGITAPALSSLMLGTLDVERAFKKHWLAVEGDYQALARFVECLAPAE
jgi:hypothetical protein